jgi:hypothetical protein
VVVKLLDLVVKLARSTYPPPFREHNRFSVFRGVDAISVSHAVRKTFRKSENGPMDYLHDFVANRAWVRDGLVREEDVYPLSLY